jgi:hypothetical protein
MVYDEHTIQLLVGRGKHKYHAEFMVQTEEDGEVIHVYTDRDHYDDFPPPLKRLHWSLGQHPIFIHVREAKEAGSYLRIHGIDTEAE